MLNSESMAQAKSEGWNVFEVDGDPTNLQLQKSDEMEIFKDDKEA